MNKGTWLSIGMIVLMVALFVFNLYHGTVSFSASEVWAALSGRDSTSTAAFIVRESRFPQAVTALLCGAALAGSGLLLQTVFSNPLADPSILGINSGASLGVAIVMLLLGGSLMAGPFNLTGFLFVVMAACVGAGIIILLLLFFSKVVRINLLLLIIGIMISYVTSSVISLLNYVSTAEGVHSYIIWGLGNFSGVSLAQLPVFSGAMILGLLATLLLIKPLNALLLGDNYATNLGINTRRTRTLLLLITGLLTALTTAYCGPISFIGLAVPHIARLMLGTADHRQLLPLTLLTGSALALICNTLCTLPGDQGLIPLNVITPFFGVPVILYVLLFKRKF
ncbi:MAG: iron ABC transporter permease [Bacteroidaceae bacterium]|nr:iron ABC transporter permease [Bacteroidaceae bacterium]